jgi:hypothetical protein
MWRTGGRGVSLREASGQGAGTTAIKAGPEETVLWHAELQAGSVDDAGYVPSQLILKRSRGVPRTGAVTELAGCFKTIVVSGEVGIKKPDPGIFRISLNRTGLRGEEVVVVADLVSTIQSLREIVGLIQNLGKTNVQ